MSLKFKFWWIRLFGCPICETCCLSYLVLSFVSFKAYRYVLHDKDSKLIGYFLAVRVML